MSDDEIQAHLRFTPRWFELKVVDEETLALICRNFRAGNDSQAEHWRYGAFMYFLDQHSVLTAELCEGLFELGGDDPDFAMGTSIMLQVLARRECPDEILIRSMTHPRTLKYSHWPRTDPAQIRQAKVSLGAEGYYAKYGFKEGRRRKDQTVYKEMRELYGIHFTRFRAVRDSVIESPRA